MIVEMPDTTTNDVAKRIQHVREAGGAISLGRVLTLVVVTDIDEPIEGAIEAAVGASSEHPSRVIVMELGDRSLPSRLDGQIRVGGDAGASEVVVLSLFGELADHPRSVVMPFLLPDTPVVTWWPGTAPENPGADSVGNLGLRRILDADKDHDRRTVLARRLANYRAGDTDLAWAEITIWRALLASALDRPPHSPITGVQVSGPSGSPSIDLLAGWLRAASGAPTRRQIGSFEIRVERDEGATVLSVDQNNNAVLTAPGKPDGRIAITRRDHTVLLAEELRRLDADEVYAMALRGVGEVDSEDAA